MQFVPRIVALAALSSWVAAALCAAPKSDLDSSERITPVPADQPIPAFDFFRLPLISTPDFNPAGTRFAAFVSNDRDRRKLVIHEVDSPKFEVIGGVGDRDIYNFWWVTDEKLWFSVSKDKRWANGAYIIDVRDFTNRYAIGSGGRELFGSLIGIPKKNRMQPLIWPGDDDGPMRLGLGSSSFGGVLFRYKAPEDGYPSGFMSDSAGELAFGFTQKDGFTTLHCFVGNQWVKSPLDLDEIDIIGAGDKDHELIVLGPRQPGKPRALQRMDGRTGQLGEILVEDAKYDLATASVYRHPVDGHVLGVRCDRRGPDQIWFDEGYREKQRKVRATLEKHFPGAVISIYASDDQEKRFFVQARSDRAPVTYHMVDFEKGSVGLIKNTRPWIDPERMQPMQVLTYKARDGVAIEGYLTLPAGSTKGNPSPLIVYPHGGPWARDSWGWDPVAQFLASRGYAVFQPNYRGSTCFEWRIPESDRFEFRKMNDDVTDGARALMKSGVIDRNRVAIMGWSFGGYLALSGAAFEPDLYRCSVALAGVFDYEDFLNERKRDGNFAAYNYLKRRLGDPAKVPEKYEAISPLRHVAKVKIPMFVGHGGGDQVVDIAHSKRLVSELDKHGVPYVKHFERDEGHGMRYTKNDVELYTAIEQFLAKNLRDNPAPATPSAPVAAALP